MNWVKPNKENPWTEKIRNKYCESQSVSLVEKKVFLLCFLEWSYKLLVIIFINSVNWYPPCSYLKGRGKYLCSYRLMSLVNRSWTLLLFIIGCFMGDSESSHYIHISECSTKTQLTFNWVASIMIEHKNALIENMSVP